MPMNGSHYCPTIHSFSTTHVSDSVDENNDPIYSPFTHQTTHPYDTSAVPGRARNTHARPPSMSRQALADLLDHYHQLLYLYDVDMINNRTSYADLRTMIRHQHTEVEAFRRAIQHSIEHIEFQILGQLQILGDQVTLLVNHIVGNQNGSRSFGSQRNTPGHIRSSPATRSVLRHSLSPHIPVSQRHASYDFSW